MGDEKARRVDDALSTLVQSFLPSSPNDDVIVREKRGQQAIDLARSIIEGHGSTAVVSDVNHASDLIKKKLLRENESPDKAVQFSNLYARLLTAPVLSQKWAILYLLYQLADSDGSDEGSSRSDASRHRLGNLQQKKSKSAEGYHGTEDEEAFTKAFSSAGLPQFPTGDSRTMAPIPSRTRSERRIEPTEDPPSNAAGDLATMPTESAILRDLPFTLQGLSSTHLPFTTNSSLTLPSTLPLPIISLLHTLAEPSLLYRSLSEFVQSKDEGLIGQSLRSAIGSELRSYLGLIATLEGEIRRAIASLDTNDPRGGINKAGVTLKRCVVWTREATMGLRLMSLMVEEAKSRKGGQLITMIHGFSTSHGDPFVGAFAERMLIHVTRPFYDMLRQWIYDGELSDPYYEFFVIEQDTPSSGERETDPRRAPATSVWEDKYKLDDSMMPTIMTDELAKKVFLIGKSLNFIRYGCGDSAWVEAYCKDASKELRYGDTATLETSIDKAYKATMARLTHLMDSKFHLFEHLCALKKYLLLGQGDFIALLMESLSSNLDRPAGSQYRHTLTAQLEHAIRGSNAQYDSQEVLRRLDARLLELSHGDIGWDVFTLEYKVDAPVDVIITPWASKKYLTVFNFLWRVKRVEFALGSTWRRCMTGARGVLANVDEKMSRDWKVARCCMAEMIHFVNQLQYYILFEVIEASWDQLQTAIAKPDCTLDDLIEAHTTYLKAITHKGLLGSPRSTATGNREDSFTSQLHHILKTMLAYKEAVDGLYSFSVAEFTRRQELAAKIETRTAMGKWGISDKDNDDDGRSPSPATARGGNLNAHSRTDSPFAIDSVIAGAVSSGDDQMLPALRVRLKELSGDFKVRVNVLLGDLAVQPDVDMKFLGVVMNFNNVYAPRKRRREGRGGERRTPGAAGGGVGAGGAGGGDGADGSGHGSTQTEGGAGKPKDKEKGKGKGAGTGA